MTIIFKAEGMGTSLIASLCDLIELSRSCEVGHPIVFMYSTSGYTILAEVLNFVEMVCGGLSLQADHDQADESCQLSC